MIYSLLGKFRPSKIIGGGRGGRRPAPPPSLILQNCVQNCVQKCVYDDTFDDIKYMVPKSNIVCRQDQNKVVICMFYFSFYFFCILCNKF